MLDHSQMTKKEIKEAVSKVCDVMDQSEINSVEYKKALKELQKIQSLFKKPQTELKYSI